MYSYIFVIIELSDSLTFKYFKDLYVFGGEIEYCLVGIKRSEEGLNEQLEK